MKERILMRTRITSTKQIQRGKNYAKAFILKISNLTHQARTSPKEILHKSLNAIFQHLLTKNNSLKSYQANTKASSSLVKQKMLRTGKDLLPSMMIQEKNKILKQSPNRLDPFQNQNKISNILLNTI